MTGSHDLTARLAGWSARHWPHHHEPALVRICPFVHSISVDRVEGEWVRCPACFGLAPWAPAPPSQPDAVMVGPHPLIVSETRTV